MNPSPWIASFALCLCATGAYSAAPDGDDLGDVSRQQIASLLGELDSDEFATRRRALERLEDLSSQEGTSHLLAEVVQEALIDPATSFEVRKQLERIRRRLPPTESLPVREIAPGEIDRLIEQLSDDSYARRLGAESRLGWLMGNADAADEVYRRIRQAAADTTLTRQQARALARVYELARPAWLENDARDNEPPTPAEGIAKWIDRVAADRTDERFPLTGESLAVVELRDLLAVKANVAPIRAALEERLARGGLSAEAERQLTELRDLTRPAMVAEYWQAGRHLNIQRLLVGVPSESVAGISHFDRVDDETAHCVTGVNLSKGDYPVGVAVPHPKPDPRFRPTLFHLVNLPTPRRRMAYEYRAKRDEAERYRAIVRRTLDRFLEKRLPIGDRELTMIMQFDPVQVSKFIGRYLVAVDDQPVGADTGGSPPGSILPRRASSVHGLLCSWLASRGTNDAIPGLLKAIDGNRTLAPTATMLHRFDRFAALALARRDPWPKVDEWLARVLSREEDLVLGEPDAPQFGATAAAILLDRHNVAARRFGLVPCDDVFARRYNLECYRYEAAGSSQEVEDWWKQQAENVTLQGPSPNEGKQER